MKNIKLGKELLISGGLLVLGVAQMVLSNKKQANEIEALKGKVVKEVMEQISESKN